MAEAGRCLRGIAIQKQRRDFSIIAQAKGFQRQRALAFTVAGSDGYEATIYWIMAVCICLCVSLSACFSCSIYVRGAVCVKRDKRKDADVESRGRIGNC